MPVTTVDPTAIPIFFDPAVQRMSGYSVHGSKKFDVPFVTEIVPGLWQGGCQDGLILPKQIKHLVSLYPWESYVQRHELDSALTVRMHDSTDQAMSQVDAIAMWVNACREDGPVLVHCQAGLNRSSLVTARALIIGGMTAADAIALIREKRSPACLCNPAFEAWLLGQQCGKCDHSVHSHDTSGRCSYCRWADQGACHHSDRQVAHRGAKPSARPARSNGSHRG